MLYSFGAEDPSSMPLLALGARGPAVVRARELLASHGYVALGQDDYYGPIIMGATQQFQRAKGLADDGIIGPNTWAALLGVPVPYRKTNQSVPSVDSGGAHPQEDFVGPPNTGTAAKKSLTPWLIGGAVLAKLLLF